MLKVGLIGIGNAGNQVVKLGKEAGFDAVALNSSERDLATVADVVTTVTVGDEKGAGKDRNVAKQFIKQAAPELLSDGIFNEVVDNKDIVVVIASAGGGTGSGMAPSLQAVLQAIYPQTHFIIAGIVPTISESLAAQQNALEYLQEMKKSNPTYMLYDNMKFESLGPVSMIRRVNAEIIEDLRVLRGDYQISTPYTSIDEKDAMKIYQTPGRLVISRATNFKEKDIDDKSIEQRLVDAVKSGAHVELETDRIIKRLGLIINLPQALYQSLDVTLPTVKKSFGESIEGFEHIAVGENYEPRTIITMSGLSFPDDRVEKTIQRIEEVKSKLTEQKASILDSYSVDSLSEARRDEDNAVAANINPLDIFNNY